MKKTYLILLLIVIAVTTNIAQTNRVVPSGSGTEADPYQISSLANLSWLAQNTSAWNKYFIQTANIDASETATWDDADDNGDGDLFNDATDITATGNNEGWISLGTETKFFAGVYDGAGYKIDGLTINRPSTSYVGFIGNLRPDFGSHPEVKELGLTNLNILADAYIGGLAGQNLGGIISKCYTTGIISSTSDVGYVAGFVGFNNSKGSVITQCYSEVNVDYNGNSNEAYIAGFVGRNRTNGEYGAVINECYSTGEINITTTGTRGRIGGFAGQQAYASIYNCYSTGKVIYVGTGNQVGGFMGRSYSDTLVNCYSIGELIATNLADAHIRGFLGSNNNNNYYSGNFIDTVASGTNGKIVASSVTGKNTSEMQTKNTYTDWDFDNVWMISGTNYPNFKALFNSNDKEAPTPNPMAFAVSPTAVSFNKITMTAVTASDISGVQYFFECLTAGGHSSNWQDSPVYIDSNLIGNTKYLYRVKARDNSKNKNETNFSIADSATTDEAPPLLFIEKNGLCAMEAEHAVISVNGDATYTGDPLTWYPDTLQAGYAGTGYMTTPDGISPNATWDNGSELSWEVEITNAGEYFIAVRRIALTGGDDSGFFGVDGEPKFDGDRAFLGATSNFAWVQGNKSIGVLDAGKHKIQVRRREAGFILDRVMIAKDKNDLPVDGSVEIGIPESLPGLVVPAPTFAVLPHVIDDTKIEMTASDPTGKIIKFYFECVTDANHNSGWITSNTYLDTALIQGTKYTYRVKGVDVNKYETEFSEEASATTEGDEPFIFNESNGICVMEAENAIVLQNGDSTGFSSPFTGKLIWEKDSTVSGFAGSGYMTTPNGIALNAGWNNGTELAWMVNIKTEAKYYIAIRRNNNNDNASETAKPGVDGVAKAYSAFWGTVDEFAWVRGPLLDSLDAGKHKIQIRRREDGLMIDRVMIATSLDALPSDGSTEVGPEESIITAISNNSISEIPADYELSQNYPNPFNPSTIISFSIPKTGNTELSIYNILGQKVATLVDKELSAGSFEYQFNASNLTSGIYFYKLQSNNFISIKKMILIK